MDNKQKQEQQQEKERKHNQYMQEMMDRHNKQKNMVDDYVATQLKMNNNKNILKRNWHLANKAVTKAEDAVLSASTQLDDAKNDLEDAKSKRDAIKEKYEVLKQNIKEHTYSLSDNKLFSQQHAGSTKGSGQGSRGSNKKEKFRL